MKSIKNLLIFLLSIISFGVYSQNSNLKEDISYRGYHFIGDINQIDISLSDNVDGKDVYDTIIPFNLDVNPHPLDSIRFLEKKISLIKEGKKTKECKFIFDFSEDRFNKLEENLYNCEIVEGKEYIQEKFIYFTVVFDNETLLYNLYVLMGTDETLF